MAVNLSPIGGVAGQFFDNNGNPLSGGRILTYSAGTTTPLPTYTSATGATPHTNPIILDAAGRVPNGEIWLTDGLQYKFIIQTSTSVQIGSYDNVIGINSNFVNYTNSQEIQTATAGQTVFTLTTMQYQPATNSLSVFVDGVNQYGPGSTYAYEETSATVVTFASGLHVGAQVKFTTSAINASSYGDAEQINYTPPFTGSVATNVEAKLAQYISVKDFGAVGDGTANDTAAVQAAIDTNQSVYFPAGVYLVDEITVPATAGGAVYSGAGYFHYTNTKQTVIKARTLTQNSIFKLASGADCITFQQMRLDGADKADKCVDGTFGAFLTLVQCGVYDAVSYGVYSLQGLMRLDRCFMSGSDVAQCHMYSDSAATDTEFTGGATCLVIASGGNRIANIWANGASDTCIAIQPLNNSTPSINNSIVNLYAGEVYGTNKAVIKIVGTSANLVQQTHISNSFIVTAINAANKVDGGIYVEYATDVSIGNVQFRGQGIAGTITAYTPYAVYAADNVDGLTISNCTFRDINRNPIHLNTNIGTATISGCAFQDWDIDENAAGADAAALRIVTGRVTATGNNFYVGGGQTQPYVLNVADARQINFDNNYMALPTPTLTATVGTVAGANRFGSADPLVSFYDVYVSIAAASVPNNAVFIDSATGKLSFKNNAGVVNALY